MGGLGGMCGGKYDCCCCMPLRLGLRVISFMTLLGGILGIISTY